MRVAARPIAGSSGSDCGFAFRVCSVQGVGFRVSNQKEKCGMGKGVSFFVGSQGKFNLGESCGCSYSGSAVRLLRVPIWGSSFSGNKTRLLDVST